MLRKKIFNIPLQIDLDPEAERQFNEVSARHFISFVRVGVVIGLLTYQVWMVWDAGMGTPESFVTALHLRMTMMAFFALVFLSTFKRGAERFIYEIAGITLLATVASTYFTLGLVTHDGIPLGMMLCGGIGMIPFVFVTAMTRFRPAFVIVMLNIAVIDTALYLGHASQEFLFSANFTHGTMAILSLCVTYVSIQYRRHAFLMEVNLARARTEAEGATNARTELLATMSHEVRTSLKNMLGFVTRLRETQLDGTQKDYVETIRYSGDTLLTILSDILDTSSSDGGKIEIEPVDFSVERLITGVIALTRSRADEKGVNISPTIDKNVPIYLRGDLKRLRQVLLNLVGNAIKFTEKKGGRVSISVNDAGGAGPNHLIRFQVEDMGTGISEAQRAKLFTAEHAARQYDGTGPGLAVCRRIVELMNGTIGCRSTSGSGSTFWFEVPLSPAKGGKSS
ncbi:MAG TPA: ATP-binding protein [Patescibacteria group bacterium]|nr:ATP-binding protein [Patescibacteria group bacterium]